MANKDIPNLHRRLKKLTKALKSIKNDGYIESFGLIGGLAVASLGIPRATKDIDFLVSSENINQFLNEIKKHFDGTKYHFDLNPPEHNVFPYYIIKGYYKHKNNEKERIFDILVAILEWQKEITENTINVKFDGDSIPIVNVEGLIVLKLKGNSAQDIIDVENILKVIDRNKINKTKLKAFGKQAGVEKLIRKIVKL